MGLILMCYVITKTSLHTIEEHENTGVSFHELHFEGDGFMLMQKESVNQSVIYLESGCFIEKEDKKVTIQFEPTFTKEDFTHAVLKMKEIIESEKYSYGKPLVTYREPAMVYSRNKRREVNSYSCTFFMHEGSLCYTPTGRSGWYIHDMSFQKVDRIEVFHESHPERLSKKQDVQDALWRRIQRERFNEVTWSDLEKDSFRENSHPFYYIKKVFNQWDMDHIQKAFEEKSSFSIRVSKELRDYSVEGRMCDDGVYRAWFSSEFSGWANGAYYLLLNPQIAVFREHD